MRKSLLLIILTLCLSLPLNLQARRFARWYTNMGNFTAEIRNELMPITGNNFIELTLNNFYNGLHFHRIIDGFVIQDGDPLGTGYGGPGYTIPDEYSELLLHDGPGVLAMAKSSQPNSAGSQYYITLAAQPDLDGDYAVFGKVIQGLDVVLNIGHVPTNSSDHPINDVVIDSLKMLGLEIGPVSPADSMLTINLNTPQQFSVEAYDVNLFVDADFQWYKNDVLQNDSLAIYNTSFNQNGNYSIKCVVSNSEISFTQVWHVTAENTSNDDVVQLNKLDILSAYPNPFKEFVNLKYQIDRAENIQVKIYDIKGHLVKSYSSHQARQGENTFSWNGKNEKNIKLPSGIYLFELKSSSNKSISKVMLLK